MLDMLESRSNHSRFDQLTRVLSISTNLASISDLCEGEQVNASFEGDCGSEVIGVAVSRSRLGFMKCGPLVASPFS